MTKQRKLLVGCAVLVLGASVRNSRAAAARRVADRCRWPT